MTSARYTGRFAPSPTGPLHFGSLLAAMASYCEARHHDGFWLLRIDDIDPPREVAGASSGIQKTLNAYGFEWDGNVIFQSQRTEFYRDKLTMLNEQHMLYPCNCSRSRLANHSVYPGFCDPATEEPIRTQHSAAKLVQQKILHGDLDHSIRISINESISFHDTVQGFQTYGDGEPGDIIVVRRDDLFAYSLACAVDDADGISHVVRGSDLLSTTASQIAIMKSLNMHQPVYSHIPVALNSKLQKLSKQTRAMALDSMPTLATLLQAWQFLGQVELNVSSIDTFWQSAIETWCLDSVPKQSQQATPI